MKIGSSVLDYIGFTLEKINLTVKDYGINMDEPAISEMWFLQLPVKNRGHFGDWLYKARSKPLSFLIVSYSFICGLIQIPFSINSEAVRNLPRIIRFASNFSNLPVNTLPSCLLI